jgi:hypothetical protein
MRFDNQTLSKGNGMNTTTTLLRQIEQAMTPQDLFPADDEAAIKRTFRRYSRYVHPDANGGQSRYSDAFAKLSELYTLALTAATDPDVTVTTRRHVYVVTNRLLATDAVADTYACSADDHPGRFKLAADPAFRDLLQQEHAVLARLHEPDKPGGEAYRPFLPTPVESFAYAEGGGITRQANVATLEPGSCPLTAVRLSSGIHPKDMAWMWRRVLNVLGYAHARGVIHGAVLPPHIWLYAREHHVVLGDWHAAVDLEANPDGHIPIIEEAYRGWYPPEVRRRQPPTPATDIYLSAATMVWLMGGDRMSDNLGLSTGVPRRLTGFLASCLLPNPLYRPQSAWQVLDDFTKLIEDLWGPRTFRPFHLPTQP